jgi:pilus assembly protein CpaF
LQRYLDGPEIEEIWVNEPGRVFIARRCRRELTTTTLAPGELADLVERMLRTSGRRIDTSTPFRGRDDAQWLPPARGHRGHDSRGSG